MKKSTTLAALGLATLSLAGPPKAVLAEPVAPVREQPSADPFPGMTWMSGEESDRRGLSGPIEETTPELPPGAMPPASGSDRSAAAAAAAASMRCPSGKQCMWTGGHFSGPGHWLRAGHAGTYWAWAESKCVNSGNPKGNWKNCASSLQNDSRGFGFTVYMHSDSTPANSYKTVGALGERAQLGPFDNNIERSVGVGS
ncbi:MAG: hypothetical protein JWO77_2866 [Ilumatobacteraceae bacterium]|nr:hypothetical protein [Ilumatobacteraceae bacterium]